MRKNIKKILWKVTMAISYIALTLFAVFQFALLVSKNKDRIINKYKKYYMLAMSWMDLAENGFVLDKYFERNGFKHIAVYGGRDMGRHLIKQLKGTEIMVDYMIDRTIYLDQFETIPVYQPDDKLPVVDAVIVTPIWDYSKIREEVSRQLSCPIISLEDVVMGGLNA